MRQTNDPSLEFLAADYMARQLKKLPRELKGLRKADNIEHLHQARVASRRLGGALEAFDECFPAKQVKRWRKQLRRLLKTLGPARDKDVQIECLRAMLSDLQDKAPRPGIARLLLRLEQERQDLQPRLLKAVQGFQADRTTDRMQSAVKRLLAKPAVRPVWDNREAGPPSPLVFERGRKLILGRLKKLVAYQDCLWNPHDIERHHQMRIEAKRFRYAMETLSAAYPGRLKQFISAARALQTMLGELHDCDIWIDQSEAFLKSERQRTIDYYGTARPFARLKVGIEHLLEQRRLQRQELFGRLGDLWNELSHRKVWEKLVRKLDSCAASGGTVQPAADFAGPLRRSPKR